MDSIYTIIVTYNGENWIRQCLTAVLDSSVKTNVIVVDNNSQDQTINLIEKNYPDVVLLKQIENLGFGRGNNKGIKYALEHKADYVFLLNQDAYVDVNTIKVLIAKHKSNTEYGIISPIHFNGTRDKLDRNFSNYLGYDYNNSFCFDAIHSKFSQIYEVPFINAAAWLLPKSTLTKIGGFDPIFFHYGEDNNYCQRIKYHGFKVGVIPDSFICHDRSPVLKTKQIVFNNLKHKEKVYKVKWADINCDNEKEILERKKQLKKTILKSFFKLNTKKIKNCIEELKLVCSIEEDILKSKQINKTIGQHYI